MEKKAGFIFIASGYCNGVGRLRLENAHLTGLDFISRMIYFCIVLQRLHLRSIMEQVTG